MVPFTCLQMIIGNKSFFPTYGKQLIKSELIEVVIPAGFNKPKIELPDNPNLRNSHIWHIETFCSLDITFSILSGSPVMPLVLFEGTFLNLNLFQGEIFLWNSPLIDFRTMYNNRNTATGGVFSNTETQPDNFTGQIVDWSKSYLNFTFAPIVPDTDLSVLMEVYYTEFRPVENRDKEASFTNKS